MMHRWTQSKKEALCNTSHTLCFILHVMDEEIIPWPALGLKAVCVIFVKVAETIDHVPYTKLHFLSLI